MMDNLYVGPFLAVNSKRWKNTYVHCHVCCYDSCDNLEFIYCPICANELSVGESFVYDPSLRAEIIKASGEVSIINNASGFSSKIIVIREDCQINKNHDSVSFNPSLAGKMLSKFQRKNTHLTEYFDNNRIEYTCEFGAFKWGTGPLGGLPGETGPAVPTGAA